MHKENYRPVADSFKEKMKRSMLYVESIKQSGIICIGRLKEDITVSSCCDSYYRVVGSNLSMSVGGRIRNSDLKLQ